MMTKDNMTTDTWYTINNVDKLDSPALVVYPDRVKENIRILKSMIDDPARLRPHVKTHKTKEATLMMMEAGINKFKCATIAEAEMLGSCEAPDVLLAYQPVGPKLLRFIQLIKQYPKTKYSCLTDHAQVAQHISEIAQQHDVTIPLFIDLNIGMNRTGIAPNERAIQLYEFCSQLPGVQIKGLHAYDGHIHETDMEERTKICNEAFAPVEQLRDTLVKKGYPSPQIIAGGSPSFPIHAQREDVECSPGTFVYWDKGYQEMLPDQPFLPAALVITRIISLPDDQKICLDLGHKSIAAENPLPRRVYFLNAPELKTIGQSEEHLVVEAEAGHRWKIGDVLYGMPIHVCPTCALYESAQTIKAGKVAGSWSILARNRSIAL
uniref:D-TA family PLP-dependent enzyme n=1 Tax=Roseihalotalea indica TaxID=2867963 RepID=A0AA49GR13_9BACT|nr:D-TA family PLP-dependent enzyme [Tunicatimonas sp. TK19036]